MYSNFKIEQSLGLIYHIQKHLNDFIRVDSFNKTLLNIPNIISKPYFMYYDSIKNSIKYYKKVEEFVCVVVNINGTSAFVSTIYPVKKIVVDKLKNKRCWHKISHEVTVDKALSEFEKYRITRDKLFKSDFDKFIRDIKNLIS